MRRGAPPWALVAVLLLLVSSCAGADQPAPDNAAVSARYENQARADAAPEAPARPEASAPARVQPAPAAATPAPATNRVVETPKPTPAATPSQADTRTSWALDPGPAASQKGADQPSAPPAAPSAPLENAVVDFGGCIRLAVERSPYLQSPSLEIQTKKLDEKDAWYRMFPNLYFTLLSDRKIAGEDTSTAKTGDSSMTLGLTSGSYNPIAAWIQHDAQKDVTRLTKLAAVLALQELIQQIATAFITLDYLDRQIALRSDIIDLNERALVFATKLENIHTSQIDIRIALQKKNIAQTEYDMAVALKGQVIMGLRDLLGLGPYDLIQPDTYQFRELIKQYDPDGYRYEYAEQNSIRIKMQEVKNILADRDITAQWIKALPTFSLGVRQPDKINNQNNQNDKEYYFSTYMQIPIWQWGETSRGFERAEIRKRQTLYANDVERLRFKSSWMMQKMQAQQQRSLLDLAQGETDLAELSLQKGEVEYRSGKIIYKQFLEAEMNVLQAKIRANELRKSYYTSLLQMVGDTGDLMRRYVNIEDLPDAP